MAMTTPTSSALQVVHLVDVLLLLLLLLY